MNYAGKFDAKLSADGSGLHSNGPVHIETVHAAHVPSDAIIVPDAHLLFHGEFKRSGVDLILSKDAQELVLHEYFKGEKRAALASPDGARLTGDIVNALSGHVEYAQADGSASVSKIIGHVTKLVGTATAIRNGVSIILNNGDNVEKGDVVESGADSRLGITFIDGTVFGLSSNARMVLNEMVYDPNGSNNSSLLSLVSGTMTFVAGDTAKHGDMKIDTPVATMGIRGTAVLVQIDFVAPKLAPGVVPDPGSLQALLPELHVQVVVEPDGTVGSLIMYEKSTLTPLAVADKAGVQINITNGIVSQSSNPLSPELQKLIDEVFTLRFTDNSNTKTTVVQNDSIIPKDGTFGFHLPDGTIVTAVFSTAINPPIVQNNSPNITPFIFFKPKVTLDHTAAEQGTTIHATGDGTNSFAWQVSSDNGRDWTTVSTDATYTPTENDEGKLLQLLVNNASQTFNLGTVAEDPAEKASISLDGLTSGHAVDGTLVTATVTDPDAPASSSIIYTWKVDGTTVASGAGLNTFTPIETEGKTLTVSVSFTDIHGNAETGTQSAGTVAPVAEPPTLTIASHTVSIAEETGTVLGISVTAHDRDDVLSITISNVPNDATLTYLGADEHIHTLTPVGGVYTLTVDQLNGLTLNAGEQTGPVTLSVTAINTTTGETASVNDTISLTVDPIQENPIFSGATATTVNEQGGVVTFEAAVATHAAAVSELGDVVTLGATVATHDADDGPISVTIAGLAHDLSTFNGGSYDSEAGTWSGTAAQFNALTFKAGEDGTQHLTITAATSGAEAGTTVENYTLTVNPIQENPIFSGAVTTAASEQGGVVTLGATVATHDADDGAISVSIAGLAHDLSTFNGGSYDSESGSWSGTAAQFNALTFKAGEDGTQHLTITAATSGAEAGSTVESYTLTVNPIQENPIFSGATATTVNEQGGVVTFEGAVATHAAAVSELSDVVTLGATVATHDADDGPISVTIAGLAHDLSAFNGGSYDSEAGTWSGTADEFNALTFKAGEDGTQHLTITAATGGAEAGSTVENYTLTVNPVAEAASLAGTATAVAGGHDSAIPLTIVATPFDSDDNLSIQITGVPSDASLNHGILNSDGSYTLTLADLSGLKFNADEGSAVLHVVVTSSEGAVSTTSSTDIGVFDSFSGGTINTNGVYTPQIINGGTAIELTNGTPYEANSWFANTVFPISGFTASFNYAAAAVAGGGIPADGMAFILQNSSAGIHALGGTGNALGYGAGVDGTAISPSAAIEFNLYAPNGTGTAFATDGGVGNYSSTGNVAFVNGDQIQAVISYDGSVLTETLTDLVNGATYLTSYTVDLATVLGAGTAYVGFSAATGANVSTQTISNFTFGPPASSTIVASAPDQTLSGIAASDTFVFNFANVGHATVTDFHPESDTLQFKSPIFANALAALSATQDDGHGNTVVAIDSHDSITLAGVLKAQLHASDFHIV